MSNNTSYWGNKYGTSHPEYGNIFRYKRPALSGGGNSGKKQDKGHSAQSKRDRELYQIQLKTIGKPAIYYNSKGHRTHRDFIK